MRREPRSFNSADPDRDLQLRILDDMYLLNFVENPQSQVAIAQSASQCPIKIVVDGPSLRSPGDTHKIRSQKSIMNHRFCKYLRHHSAQFRPDQRGFIQLGHNFGFWYINKKFHGAQTVMKFVMNSNKLDHNWICSYYLNGKYLAYSGVGEVQSLDEARQIMEKILKDLE